MPTMAAKTKNQPLDYQFTNHKTETPPPTITTTTASTPHHTASTATLELDLQAQFAKLPISG